MKYMVDARTVIFLMLLACASILLAVSSAVFGLQARQEIHKAKSLGARADSLLADWDAKKCVPR